MRRQAGFFILVGLLTVFAPLVASASPAVTTAAAESAGDLGTAPVAVRVDLRHTGLRDEAAMVLIGTALIVLAGAVRRAA